MTDNALRGRRRTGVLRWGYVTKCDTLRRGHRSTQKAGAGISRLRFARTNFLNFGTTNERAPSTPEASKPPGSAACATAKSLTCTTGFDKQPGDFLPETNR